MNYVKLYVYSVRTAEPALYIRGGFRRPFVLTTLLSPEFQKLVATVPEERPIYALIVDKNQIKSGELAQLVSRPVTGDDEVVLIPCGINSLFLPLYAGEMNAGARSLRPGVIIDRALMFSSGSPMGHIDEALIDNPLDILKRKELTVSKGSVASTRSIAESIWKVRSKIFITGKRISLSEEERFKNIKDSAEEKYGTKSSKG